MLNWPRETRTKGDGRESAKNWKRVQLIVSRVYPYRWLVSPGRLYPRNAWNLLRFFLFRENPLPLPAGLTLTACNAGKQLEAASFKPGHRFFRVATPLKAGKFKTSLQAT